MPWTPRDPNGWPYMISSQPIRDIPTFTQALSDTLSATVGGATIPPDETLDTGWVDINSALLAGFNSPTGLKARAAFGLIEIRVDVQPTGSWSTGTNLYGSGVPSVFRPSETKFAACYAGGQLWIAFIRSNGELAVTNTSGSTSGSRCQATILFMG